VRPTGVGSVDAVTDEHREHVEPGEQSEPDTPGRIMVRRRNAPRYRAFGGTGAFIGLAVGFTLAMLPEINPGAEYSRQEIVAYFAVTLGLIGTLLGLGVAILIERRH
jgi:hypothetical protein